MNNNVKYPFDQLKDAFIREVRPRPFSFEEAKSKFTNRYTGNHFPAWAQRAAYQAFTIPPAFPTDYAWYIATTFPGEKDIPTDAKYCVSKIGDCYAIAPLITDYS